ncbi:unnamed protein product [Protopolystoma xenopodis]|uniref:Uncharacterized protein n=1 Tax=Protopolystoma xenopodis TaxID=117903 RepID=A0A448XFF3_9PLAT|nr:unnamed protein product [Protopolystoma xenopodis]
MLLYQPLLACLCVAFLLVDGFSLPNLLELISTRTTNQRGNNPGPLPYFLDEKYPEVIRTEDPWIDAIGWLVKSMPPTTHEPDTPVAMNQTTTDTWPTDSTHILNNETMGKEETHKTTVKGTTSKPQIVTKMETVNTIAISSQGSWLTSKVPQETTASNDMETEEGDENLSSTSTALDSSLDDYDSTELFESISTIFDNL